MDKRINEALRYLGVRPGGAENPAARELQEAAKDMLNRLESSITPKTLLRVYALSHQPDGSIVLTGADGCPILTLSGRLAQTMLKDCQQAALMLSTLGLPFDSMLRTQQARGMAEAAMLDALGNVLVEEACDRLEEALRSRFPHLHLTDRFSPGYGDLPLSLQPGLLAALDATRQAGVYLTDSCLMNPSKTVTAIVGLSARPQAARIRGCAFCTLRDTCTYRKDGIRCDSF